MNQPPSDGRARFRSPYWFGEMVAYLGAAGWADSLALLRSRIFWSKVGRTFQHRARALAGRVIPLQETLDSLYLRPPHLHLEFSNVCNANCIFCPYQHQKRKKQLMSQEVFDRAVTEWVSLGGGPVRLTPIVGDALLHPKFIEWVGRLRSYPEIDSIFLTTNGIMLDKHGFTEILDSGLTSIILSTAGFERSMFERVFRCDSYYRMLNNFLSLLEHNAKRGRPLDIRIALRPDRALPRVLKDPDFQPILALNTPLTFHWALGTARGRISADTVPETMPVRTKTGLKEPCEYLLRGPVVLSNGDVLACCCSPAAMDAETDLGLGNILKSSLMDMWNSAKMERLRQSFAAKDLTATCSGCGQYEGLDLFRTPGGRRLAKLNRLRQEEAARRIVLSARPLSAAL